MEGIWYAHFTSGPAQGDGVAVLRDGEILGADPRHTYSGSYREDGNVLYADIRVTPYAIPGDLSDIEHPFSLFLTGSFTERSASVSGHPTNRPDVTVNIELRRGG